MDTLQPCLENDILEILSQSLEETKDGQFLTLDCTGSTIGGPLRGPCVHVTQTVDVLIQLVHLVTTLRHKYPVLITILIYPMVSRDGPIPYQEMIQNLFGRLLSNTLETK